MDATISEALQSAGLRELGAGIIVGWSAYWVMSSKDMIFNRNRVELEKEKVRLEGELAHQKSENTRLQGEVDTLSQEVSVLRAANPPQG